MPSFLLLAGTAALLVGSTAGLEIAMAPGDEIVYMEFPRRVTILATEGSFDTRAGSAARCAINSVNNAFVNQNYTDAPDAYKCMKNLSASVVSPTRLTCDTVAVQNGSPARVQVSMDSGRTWSNATFLEVVPAFEWALGRRPYVAEPDGSIIYNVHPSLLGASGRRTLSLEGRLRPHHGNESSQSQSSSSLKFPPHYFDRHTTVGLANPSPPLIRTSITVDANNLSGHVDFSLASLPPTVYEDFVLTVATVIGSTPSSSTKWKRFHKVPVPPAGSNTTVFSVDHTTAGMLMGQGESPWLPFTALGWFNSPFEYAHESVGDMSLIAPDADMYAARGGSFATEWGKKGHTLLRIGCDHQNDPARLLAILDECERAGI